MTRLTQRIIHLVSFLICFLFTFQLIAQRTQIKGFVAVDTYLEDGKVSFGLGEQDLFITSELNDNFSFLGETVFKYSPNSPTKFNVSVERIIINYNYLGNHNVLIGKHHTPINYWNDTYHHGRVFFPTIGRPLLFDANIIPIHTTGLEFMGLNLGKLKFGYNFLIGNGIGSSDVTDNDKYKSITAAVHIKPKDKMQVGLSFYSDVLSEGTVEHGLIIPEKINQQLYTGTVAHFGSKFEFLAEGTFAANRAESTGIVNSFSSYLYSGVRLNEKLVPYIRLDYLDFQDEEIYFDNEDTFSFLAGLRYEINFLIVVKMEYQHVEKDAAGNRDIFNTQIAIGF